MGRNKGVPDPNKDKYKALKHYKRNPKSVLFSDFQELILAFGFKKENTKKKGSHIHLYKRDDVREFINVQPNNEGHAKPDQINDFYKIVNKYNL